MDLIKTAKLDGRHIASDSDKAIPIRDFFQLVTSLWQVKQVFRLEPFGDVEKDRE